MSPAHVALDGHVHLRDPALDVACLAAAARNFGRYAAVPSRTAVLMLTDSAGEDAFARLRESLPADHGALRTELTSEPESLWVYLEGWRLLVLAGRQIITAERLEVLALATPARFDDGLPLAHLLPQIESANGVPVLPWGCGKWIGTRRRQVAAAIRDSAPGQLLLGDNGGRPGLWRDGLLDGFTSRPGLPVLRGTDPLPLPGHWRRVGSYGSVVDVALPADFPAAALRTALRDPAVELRPYGHQRGIAGFLRDQLSLRMRRLPGGLPARSPA
jgi:hypothetical protein